MGVWEYGSMENEKEGDMANEGIRIESGVATDTGGLHINEGVRS